MTAPLSRLPERPAWLGAPQNGWRRARLSAVASVRARIGWKALTADEYVADGYPLLATPNIKTREIDFDDVNYVSEFRYRESPELQLAVGDVLLAKDGNTLGIVNRVTNLPRPATVNGSIAVIRPLGVNSAFLRYYIESRPVQALIAALRAGMGVPHLFQFDLNRFPVLLPTLEEQQAIVEYLDRETARIDALMLAKQRMSRLAREQFAAWREHLLVTEGERRWVPLQHLTDPRRPVVYGIVQAGEEFPGGVPYIKTGDLASLDPDLLSRTSPEIDAAYRRARVVPGDLVVAMRASIGEVVQVPESLAIANLTQGTARVAAGLGVNARWLLHAFRTRVVQEQCVVRAVGTTFRTLNIWDLRRIRLPVPAASSQARLSSAVDEREGRLAQVEDSLRKQLALLAERRQALITDAVTGELPVTVPA